MEAEQKNVTMKVQDFFKKWTATRPNLKVSFHDAGIEAMAFAEAYHKALSEVAPKEEIKVMYDFAGFVGINYPKKANEITEIISKYINE